MNIWLIQRGEPVHIDENDVRLMRTGILADTLSKKGHKVTWFTSTFYHQKKYQRFKKNTVLSVKKNLNIFFIKSPGYKRNISFKRLWDHFLLVRRFDKVIQNEPLPDVILCSFPMIGFTYHSAQFAKKNGILHITDIRDLWPDVFLNYMPMIPLKFKQMVLKFHFQRAKNAFKTTDYITGLTDEFIQWAVKLADRERQPHDRVFPMAYLAVNPEVKEVSKAENKLIEAGLNKKKFNISFIGTLSRQFKYDTIIEAARMLNTTDPDIVFIFCGTGDKLNELKDAAKMLENIIFTGWLNRAEIWQLMKISKLGLAPYRNLPNFTLNLPNKPIEYLSSGLPILSSIDGILGKTIRENRCGIVYDPDNPEELIEIVKNLYKNPGKLKQMSKNARQLYRKKFVAEKVYKEMVEYLEESVLQSKK